MPSHSSTTIALLHPGDLGTALGRILLAEGHRILAPITGRSPLTQSRAREAGFELVASAVSAIREAEIVLSVVPPSVSASLLDGVLDALHGSGRTPLFVDANSISPATARTLQSKCAKAGVPMVDMAVQGQASGLPNRGTLFFSGERADSTASLFGTTVATRVVGIRVGDASQFKLLLSSLYKSMTALYLEVATNAQRAGALQDFLETTRDFYPGMVKAVESMLPSYPTHAPRRVDELLEVEAMLAEMNIKPGMVHQARILLQRLAGSSACRKPDSVPVEDSLSLLATLTEALDEANTISERND